MVSGVASGVVPGVVTGRGAGVGPEPLFGRRGWVLTEGHAGMEIQACALATALGLSVEVKRVPAPPWGWLPAPFWPFPLAAARSRGADLAPPWPDLLISCGRRAVAPALAVRRAARQAGVPLFAVHIQNPKVNPERFDAVIAPLHDGLTGRRVIRCLGSLHGFTPENLAARRAQATGPGADADGEGLAPELESLPRPLVAVMIGGPTRAFPMPERDLERLAGLLCPLARQGAAGLAVIPSRRTGRRRTAFLRRALQDSGAFLWDGRAANPYRALLAAADAFVVTGDSVNMVCEAAATGKPVHVFALTGGSVRLAAFHDAMESRGHTRPFTGAIDWGWHPAVLAETRRVAELVAARYLAQNPSRG